MTAEKSKPKAVAPQTIDHDKESVEDFMTRVEAIRADPENNPKEGESDDEFLKRMGAVDVTDQHNGLGIIVGLGGKVEPVKKVSTSKQKIPTKKAKSKR